MQDGVNFSINTDDPTVLGNSMDEDYKACNDMGLTDNDLIKGVSEPPHDKTNKVAMRAAKTQISLGIRGLHCALIG